MFFINDSEPRAVNRFHENSDELGKSIEKKISKYVETLEVVFSSYMIKYTMVNNKIKRSSHGEGSDALNIFEYEGELCYIPTGNGCSRKCLGYLQKRFFKRVQRMFITFR